MAASGKDPVVLTVDSVSQLFNAPDANPFVNDEATVLGEAAFDRLLRRQLVERRINLAGVPLWVSLPADQVTPDLEPQLAVAIQRYCDERIEDNRLTIRHSRLQHGMGLGIVFLLTLLVAAVAYLLLVTVFADSSSVVQGIIAGLVCVFTWVILWDPLEALLFEWVEPARENRVLEQIRQMPVSIQPRS